MYRQTKMITESYTMAYKLFRCYICGKYVVPTNAYVSGYDIYHCYKCHKHMLRPRFKAVLSKLLPDRIIDYYPRSDDPTFAWKWRPLIKCNCCQLYKMHIWLDYRVHYMKNDIYRCIDCHERYDTKCPLPKPTH